MSVKLNILRKLVRELIKRELEEATMTGNIDGGAGPPKTPKAFKKKKKGQDESGFQDGHGDPTVSTSYRKVKESVNEAIAKDVPFNNFDWPADKNKIKKLASKYGLKVAKVSQGPNYEPTAVLKGDEKKLIKFLTSKDYGVDDEDAQEMIESINEDKDWDLARAGNVAKLADNIIKKMKIVKALHLKGKNKEAKVVLNNKVYSDLDYIGRAFSIIDSRPSESVNEVAIRPSDKLIANKRWQMSQLDIEKALLKDKKVAKHIGKADIDIYFDDNELVAGESSNTIVAVKNNWTLDDLKKAILKQNPKKWQESITINGKKYKPLNENNQSWAKYYSWRNDKSMTPKQKIGMSMREVRDSLQELEKIVFRSIKLKKELKVGSDNYWKSTHSALRRIHERLVKLTGKIANLY